MGAKNEDGRVVFASEREFELHMLASAAAHHAAGLESFARCIEEKAGKAFVAGRDESAEVLRELAKEALRMVKAKRDEQERWMVAAAAEHDAKAEEG